MMQRGSPARRRKAPLIRHQTEESFQQQVEELAELLGWWTFHVYNSRKSKPGWPDLSCFSETQKGRALFIELKKETGIVSISQRICLARLVAAGQEAGVIRPSDWDRLVRVLQGDERLV